MARPDFAGLTVFVTVAQEGSLTRAAAVLGVRPPAISYQLKMLEDQIGTPLFARTTRSLSLTDAGRVLLARAAPALAQLEDALQDVRDSGDVIKGTLRLTLPYIAFDMTFADRLKAFQDRYPDILLDLSFSEAFVDVVGEGFHGGIRLGENIQQEMTAVRLCSPFREVVFASPAYLAERGRPRVPRDLLDHSCIRYRYITSGRFAEWRFRQGEAIISLDVSGQLIVNSTPALVRAAVNGSGLAWLFRPAVSRELELGLLETVLDDHALPHPGYFLYFPKSSQRIPAFRAFVDFMKAGL
nr:LysR family transcriptional regulator [uncultured Gellertiella sp.]